MENNADGKTYFYDLVDIKSTTDSLDIMSIPTNNIVGTGFSSTNTSTTKVGNKSSSNSQNNNITASNTSSGNSNNDIQCGLFGYGCRGCGIIDSYWIKCSKCYIYVSYDFFK